MPTIRIPYHKRHLEASLPDNHCISMLVPENDQSFSSPSLAEEQMTVSLALNNPIDSPCLEALAVGKKTCTVITSDHTRPVPSHITLPLLLERLRRGNPDIAVTILVATGCHRATSDQEMRDKFGDAVIDREHVVIHDCEDRSSLRHAGSLPSGGALWLNTHALDTDLLIAEGFIEPHFFAGFSGGRKSVLPGVAGRQTVLANHCSKFIADSSSRTGNLDNNPIHKDMLFAAEQSRLAFILNVTLNEDKTIHGAFAGHSVSAHLQGCREMKARVAVPGVKADIAITSNGGYPLDQNIYQAVKGMTAAEACCRDGGTIIMVAGCSDGHGGEAFYRSMAEADTPQAVLEKALMTPQDETPPDQWEYQILARILSRCTVVMVSDLCDSQIIRDMHMKHASSLQEAVDGALKNAADSASIAVIPDGVTVIIDKVLRPENKILHV